MYFSKYDLPRSGPELDQRREPHLSPGSYYETGVQMMRVAI